MQLQLELYYQNPHSFYTSELFTFDLFFFIYFFEQNPCKHPIVILQDVHPEYMKLLITYMYKGEVYCLRENVSSLLRTAHGLKIRGLIDPKCIAFALAICFASGQTSDIAAVPPTARNMSSTVIILPAC